MSKISIVGWLGVVLILAAFTLTTFGVIQPTSLIYGVLNLVGALGVIVSSRAKKDSQPVILNSVWFIIAALGILKSLTS